MAQSKSWQKGYAQARRMVRLGQGDTARRAAAFGMGKDDYGKGFNAGLATNSVYFPPLVVQRRNGV